MKYLPLLSFFVLAACSTDVVNTAQDLTVNLKGAQDAYCILSTKDNRYALSAPGKTLVERGAGSLTIDCTDNHSDRRRTVVVKPEVSMGYWSYPSSIEIDFSETGGHCQNGFRLESKEESVTEILTEKSYSRPVDEPLPEFEIRAFPAELSEEYTFKGQQPIELMANQKMQDNVKAVDLSPSPQNDYIGKRSYPVR